MFQNHREIGKGKVATIVTPTEIALNVGANDGIEVDDLATIYERVEVKDPDTGTQLGALRVPRLKLRVRVVHDRFSTAVVTDREPMGSIADAAKIRSLKKIVVRERSNQVAPANSVLVKIGDEVVIRRPEKDDQGQPPF